jgi:hypothetical protein
LACPRSPKSQCATPPERNPRIDLATANPCPNCSSSEKKKSFGYQCAMRRSAVSPAQPGGTRKEVPGSDDLPRSETVTGTRACQETGDHAETSRVMRQGIRTRTRELRTVGPRAALPVRGVRAHHERPPVCR